MRDLAEPVVLRPLPGFPVIRDLVVDMTRFFAQYDFIKPYLINDERPPEKERLQSPAERDKLDGLYECILCACCTSQCPSSRWNPDGFAGPAGLLQAERFIVDSRDRATRARLDDLNDVYRLFRCRTIMPSPASACLVRTGNRRQVFRTWRLRVLHGPARILHGSSRRPSDGAGRRQGAGRAWPPHGACR